jgi:hypothetical protein
VDSIGMASGGDPQDAGGIIKAMIAARGLGVPVLGIHHLPKEAKDKSRPYGSVYAAAEARMTWLVEKDEDSPVGALRIALSNKKSNRSARHPRMAYEFRFTTSDDREALESVTLAPVGFMEAINIGSSGAQKWRLAAFLTEPMSLDALSHLSGITKATVRMQLNRHKDLFVRVGDLWSRISDANQDESVIRGPSALVERDESEAESVMNRGKSGNLEDVDGEGRRLQGRRPSVTPLVNRRERAEPPWAADQIEMDDTLVAGG